MISRAIRVFCGICFLFIIELCPKSTRPIVLIDPAGHAKNLGRLLVEGYERAETLKLAHAIKERLLRKYRVRPVISRRPGEEISHRLQIPSFSNRLGADFFLRIHMYREESEKPKLFLYHLLFHPMVDLAVLDRKPLSLIHVQQAHFGSIHITRFYGETMYDYLNQELFKKYFDCFPLQGLPIASMIGITAPAVLVEIGICRENKWKSLVGPIVDSLRFLSNMAS